MIVGIFALAFAMGACGRRARVRDARQAVNLQTQIARQTRCPLAQIQVQHLGGQMWQAYVCGQQVQYQCHRWQRCVPIGATVVAQQQVVVQQPQPQQVVVQQPQPQQVVVQQPQPQAQTVVVVPHQASEGPAQQSLDAATQTAFNARRDAILACMGGQPTVLYLRWQADGALTVSLGGALNGTAQEACVRNALSDFRFRSGVAGSAVHTIQ